MTGTPEETKYWIDLSERLEKERDTFFEYNIKIVKERDVLQKKLDFIIAKLVDWAGNETKVYPRMIYDFVKEIRGKK